MRDIQNMISMFLLACPLIGEERERKQIRTSTHTPVSRRIGTGFNNFIFVHVAESAVLE